LSIDPRAAVSVEAQLAADVEVGPFAVIGPGVVIGAGCRIGPHAVINGPTVMGEGNRVFQFASIGDDPQDMKYRGEPTRLVIGARNTFREYVSINRGTVTGAGETRIVNDILSLGY
jgi:UDP-N-acetylglucosamine acyltransferase